MKIFQDSTLEITKTEKYKSAVKSIVKNNKNKYKVLINNEKNYIKKVFLYIKCKIITQKQISKLTSIKNLY